MLQINNNCQRDDQYTSSFTSRLRNGCLPVGHVVSRDSCSGCQSIIGSVTLLASFGFAIVIWHGQILTVRPRHVAGRQGSGELLPTVWRQVQLPVEAQLPASLQSEPTAF